ncbi:MAG: hypothetical protein KatS3mg061_2607 [Dehalococcoidia bacterium]|nr:MAG: hypothetical protein KatS3mg061_2607 [Dehalococcoidia bacterium]
MDNRLLAGPAQGRLPRSPLLLVGVVGGGMLVALLGALLLGPLVFWLPPELAATLPFGGIWLALWIWVSGVERRPFRSVGLEAARPVGAYLRGAGLGLVSLSLVVAGLVLVGAARLEGLKLSAEMLLPLALAALGYSVQGSAEELLLRGWLLPVVAWRGGLVAGLIAQAALFALLHGANPGVTPIALLNLVLVSFVLAFWALAEQQIWPVMGWHAAWNWAQSHLFGLPVSGLNFTAALLPTTITGPEWLSGGGFGVEGSILTSVLLLASGVVLARWRSGPRRAGNP